MLFAQFNPSISQLIDNIHLPLNVMTDVESLRLVLSANKQQHLLQFWDQLNQDHKQLLFKDLSSIDFAKVCKSFEQTINSENETNEKIDDLLEPLSSQVNQSITRTSPETIQLYRESGEQ